MLKKVILIFIIIALISVMSSACSKKFTGDNINSQNDKVQDSKIEQLPKPPQQAEESGKKVETQDAVLTPPKSFISDGKSNIPANKVYYTGKVVVLMYHHISSKPFSSITVKPERFEEDLKMLKDNFFNVVSLRDVIRGMQGEVKYPANAVAITFDDGIESFYKYAYPQLKKYNMPAVNFIITSRNESYSPSENDFNPLSQGEIKEMYKSGLIDIQSHSDNGHDYIVRNEKGDTGGKLAFREYYKSTGKYESLENYNARVVDDLTKSIEVIQKYTGNKPDTLCFPFGHYNSGLTALSQKAGFKYFVTTVSGNNKENSKSIFILRLRAGEAKKTTDNIKQGIINCGQGRPASQWTPSAKVEHSGFRLGLYPT